jgi:hypothetical protein
VILLQRSVLQEDNDRVKEQTVQVRAQKLQGRYPNKIKKERKKTCIKNQGWKGTYTKNYILQDINRFSESLLNVVEGKVFSLQVIKA